MATTLPIHLPQPYPCPLWYGLEYFPSGGGDAFSSTWIWLGLVIFLVQQNTGEVMYQFLLQASEEHPPLTLSGNGSATRSLGCPQEESRCVVHPSSLPTPSRDAQPTDNWQQIREPCWDQKHCPEGLSLDCQPSESGVKWNGLSEATTRQNGLLRSNS